MKYLSGRLLLLLLYPIARTQLQCLYCNIVRKSSPSRNRHGIDYKVIFLIASFITITIYSNNNNNRHCREMHFTILLLLYLSPGPARNAVATFGLEEQIIMP